MVAWVIPAISVGLQLMSSFGQASSEKQAETANKEYQAKQRAAAWANYQYQTRALRNRFSEEKESSAYEIEQINIKNMQAKATASTSAAEGGVSGSTIDNLFKDYDRANAASQYIAKRNLYLKGLQTSDAMDAAWIEANNVINNMQPYTSNVTSLLLSGFGNALSTYANTSWKNTFYNTRTGLKQ